jgi:16S rRNA (guanine966-N2)-methyltransferase
VKKPNIQTNQVRIIAGLWRGRKIEFPEINGLRPTPDRVRETLFNWLSPHIIDAHCLDLFAGSGVLGFEALSRGAKGVTFVDSSYIAIQKMRDNAKKLQITLAHFSHASVPALSLDVEEPFDIVFIDPPYAKDLVNPSIQWLHHHHYLKDNALIYVEKSREDPELILPTHWEIIRNKTAGQVNYLLINTMKKEG